MAMKPSSKFERMKLKPSQAMKAKMPVGTNAVPDPEDDGAPRTVLPAKLRPAIDPKVKARREAMRKAATMKGIRKVPNAIGKMK